MLTRPQDPSHAPHEQTRARPPAPGQWRDAFGHLGSMRRQPVRSVTIVTVCFNASDSIRLTLESVKRQSFPNVEHVVIDGGSKDGTQNIVREYNVAYFVSERDKGIYDAMEKGARAARGDILIFLNAGDLFYDDDVCADVAKFFPEAGADFVFGDLMPAYLRPSDRHDHGAFRAGDLLKLGYYQNRRHIYEESIHHQATFYRRWIFSKCSYYSEAPNANGEYNVLMCAALRHNASIKYMPRPISRFMLGGTSTSNFQEEWARYAAARDALRQIHCPDPAQIRIASETEFRYVRPEPVKIRTKKWLKSAVKSSPPFKIYDRLALGLSMRMAGAIEHRFQALESSSAATRSDLQNNFSLIGGVLDATSAQATAANAKLIELERRLAALERVEQAVCQDNATIVSKLQSAADRAERDALGIAAHFDAKLIPVQVALQRTAEEISALVSRYGQDIVTTIQATAERDAHALGVRLDAKLTPIEIALQRAAEEITAQVSGYGQELALGLRATSESVDQRLKDANERVLVALSDASARTPRGKDMADYGFRAFSQWDEDGLIQFLVSELEVENNVFAEIGVGDYSEANTRLLLLKDNWRGAIFDCGADEIAAVKTDKVYWRHTLEAVETFITAENVNGVLAKAGLSGDIGLMSIDIDGMDYWVWKALRQVTPQILIVEYNGVLCDDRAIVVPYDAKFDRRAAHYSWLYAGASLPALILLGEDKGYVYVGCNSAGNNAFFVRKEIFAASGLHPSKRRFVKPRFRESRNRDGTLAFLGDEDARKLIEGMPFVDVRTGASVRL